MKAYYYTYWREYRKTVRIEAESKDEADAKIESMIENDEIDDTGMNQVDAGYQFNEHADILEKVKRRKLKKEE